MSSHLGPPDLADPADDHSLLGQLTSWLRLPGASGTTSLTIEGVELAPPDGVAMPAREVVTWTAEGRCRYQLWYLPPDEEPRMVVDATLGRMRQQEQSIRDDQRAGAGAGVRAVPRRRTSASHDQGSLPSDSRQGVAE